jgi:hypothetical protein
MDMPFWNSSSSDRVFGEKKSQDFRTNQSESVQSQAVIEILDPDFSLERFSR